MDNAALAKIWAMVAGAILVIVGILGFFPNAIVGPSGLFMTDTLHSVVHLGTGILALAVYASTTGEAKANALIGFGILYGVIFVAVLASPTLFGLFAVPANLPLHVVHAALAVVSLAVGFMARGSYEPARA